jgi:flagellar P-ring protein precursor FlgI
MIRCFCLLVIAIIDVVDFQAIGAPIKSDDSLYKHYVHPFHKNNPQSLKVRLKDIAQFTDVRDNQLVGYGLVVGLNGTGDTLNSIPYTKESLSGMLERLGVNMRDHSQFLSGKNVAAVMVSSILPPFARHGSRIDVTVSALGDAKDLRGGTLLVTPLLSGRDEVVAVAQGQVNVSGIAAQGRAMSVTDGVPTSGKIINGAIVEKEVDFELKKLKKLRLGLRNPDATTSSRVSQTINNIFQQPIASSLDPATIDIKVPLHRQHDLVNFMMEIEQLTVHPDQSAKIYIDPSGVIVMGAHVKIAPVAITHGSISIKVIETPEASQPNLLVQSSTNIPPMTSLTLPNQTDSSPLEEIQRLKDIYLKDQEQSKLKFDEMIKELQKFKTADNLSQIKAAHVLYDQELQNLDQTYQTQLKKLNGQVGEVNTNNNLQSLSMSPQSGPQTVVLDRSLASINEEKGKFSFVEGATLDELVDALNALGVSPRDMADILKGIKATGAIQAEIIGT